jgi:hypothetical protein
VGVGGPGVVCVPGQCGYGGEAWPHVRQVLRVVRERERKGKRVVKVSYGITSLGPEEADAQRLLSMQRFYWGIENRLHWVRDVALGNDASQSHSDSAPQVCAGMRNLTLALLRHNRTQDCASTLRTFAGRPSLPSL